MTGRHQIEAAEGVDALLVQLVRQRFDLWYFGRVEEPLGFGLACSASRTQRRVSTMLTEMDAKVVEYQRWYDGVRRGRPDLGLPPLPTHVPRWLRLVEAPPNRRAE